MSFLVFDIITPNSGRGSGELGLQQTPNSGEEKCDSADFWSTRHSLFSTIFSLMFPAA